MAWHASQVENFCDKSVFYSYKHQLLLILFSSPSPWKLVIAHHPYKRQDDAMQNIKTCAFCSLQNALDAIRQIFYITQEKNGQMETVPRQEGWYQKRPPLA